MTFQFSLWDKFKDLDSLPSSTFSNLVQLVTHFLQKKCLSLSILKVHFSDWMKWIYNQSLPYYRNDDDKCNIGHVQGLYLKWLTQL